MRGKAVLGESISISKVDRRLSAIFIYVTIIYIQEEKEDLGKRARGADGHSKRIITNKCIQLIRVGNNYGDKDRDNTPANFPLA